MHQAGPFNPAFGVESFSLSVGAVAGRDCDTGLVVSEGTKFEEGK